MKTMDVTWAEFARGVLLLGRQGENLTSRLHVDVSEPLAKYPGASFGMRACTADGTVYPAAQVEESRGMVTWTITDADTAQAGEGWAQLVMYGGGEEIAKTEIAHTLVLPSLKPNETEPPDPVADWITRAEGVLDDLKQAGAGNVGAVRYDQPQNLTDAQKAQARENIGAGTGNGSGGVDFETDETLSLKNGILSVNTTDEAQQDNPLPMTSQGVYNEFAVINALLKTI